MSKLDHFLVFWQYAPLTLYFATGLVGLYGWLLIQVRHLVTRYDLMLYLTATAGTWYLSEWHEVDTPRGTLVSLHLQPVLMYAYLMILHHANIRVATALTFFSVLVVDVSQAMRYFHDSSAFEMFYGIGGAGAGDGLALVPLTLVLLRELDAMLHPSLYGKEV